MKENQEDVIDVEEEVGQSDKAMLVKVIVKLFKVAEASNGDGKQTKKTYEVEATLNGCDFKSKQSLVTALERECDLKETAR